MSNNKTVKGKSDLTKNTQIVAHLFLINSGNLNLYHLIRRSDSLVYFKLQHKFESLGNDLIFFYRINNHNIVALNQKHQIQTFFYDNKSK
jgi:hypothetical protein